MAPRASINDVATLAGVSLGTVSNALNHPDRVSARTMERVTAAIEKLGYVPNTNARSLAHGASRSIGLLLPDLGNSFFVDVARGAESLAEERGYTLTIAHTDAQLAREQRYVDAFLQARAAGIVLAMNDDDHYTALAGRAHASVPTVVVNLDLPAEQACSVTVDHEHGAWLATTHLTDLGRARLAFVGGPSTLRPLRQRAAGFERALRERGLSPVRTLHPEHVNRADGWALGHALADDVSAGRIDGIVASTDLLAAGIVQALSSVPGLHIPHHVAVVGYDNNQAAWDSPVPITTIAQPGRAIGREALRLLLDEANPDHAHEAVVLTPELVVRASTVAERRP